MSISEVTSFMVAQLNIENQEKIDKRNFDYNTIRGSYVRKTLSTFTSVLYGKNVTVSVGASKYSSGQSLIINKGDIKLEFLQLSRGEKYIFSMVLELIYRNIILNPKIENYEKTSGIVLIDELESHLHPRWQLTILEALQCCFPKIQFIVSTHSPLVVSSVQRSQIVALSNFSIIPSDELPNIYSGTADELLKGVLFSDIQIKKYKSEKEEIERLIKKFEYDKAEEKLEAIKAEIKSDPKWIRDFERKISFGQS